MKREKGGTEAVEIITEIVRTAGHKTVVQLLCIKGEWFADMRKYLWSPWLKSFFHAKQGVTLRAHDIPQIIRGLMEAYKRLQEKGEAKKDEVNKDAKTG